MFVALSLFLAAAASTASAQDPQSTFPATPLVSKTYAYPTEVPYQADTDTNLVRGVQSGYNRCNETTEGQDSMCQTSFLNALDDFCLWAPPDPNSLIADTEGEEVAWCTKPGRGTRLIPEGALRGVQFTRTPDYVQVVGFIDQTKINIQAGDFGGELDPHGADLRGNPLGGLFYSTAWSGNNDTYTQVIEWHNFMGGDAFCLKACDPSRDRDAEFCQHIFDRIGCAYNAPNNAQNGTFESCDGDSQDPPGVYTDASGQVVTYTQPPEDQGAIATMPYQPKVPASSNCVQFTSSEVFAALATATSSSGSSSPSGSSGSGNGNGSGSGTATGTSSGSESSEGSDDGAVEMTISLVSMFGVILSIAFLS